jgi:CheY-like chemotaxis protein
MRALVADDDDHKRHEMAAVLKESIPHVRVQETRSYRSTLSEVLTGAYDVFLLDMTLPTFDVTPGQEEGGASQAFGGREVLRHMLHREISVPTIIVTQFDHFGEGRESIGLRDLGLELAELAPHLFRGVIQYRRGGDSWRQELRQLAATIAAERGRS